MRIRVKHGDKIEISISRGKDLEPALFTGEVVELNEFYGAQFGAIKLEDGTRKTFGGGNIIKVLK